MLITDFFFLIFEGDSANVNYYRGFYSLKFAIFGIPLDLNSKGPFLSLRTACCFSLGRKRNVRKSLMNVQSYCFAYSTYKFLKFLLPSSWCP